MSKSLKPFYFTSNSDFPFIICPSGLRALQNILYLPDVILGIGNLKFFDLSVYFLRSILIKIDLKKYTERSKNFKLPMPNITSGKYNIFWRALSPDGHIIKGKSEFEVK